MSSFKSALATEKAADIAESSDLLKSCSPKALESKGLAMQNLTVVGVSTGLGGRTILELGPDRAIGSFDSCFRIGDVVKVAKQQKRKAKDHKKDDEDSSDVELEATVVRVSQESLCIAIEGDDAEVPQGRLWLVKLVNLATYKRMDWALEKLEDGRSRLASMMKGSKDLSPTVREVPITAHDMSLNSPQLAAVQHAVGSELSVIHGPPGTGKTQVVIEIARQLVERGERILICGPSNISVDNVVERLAPHFKQGSILRLGHPARLLKSILPHSLDIASKTSDEGIVVRSLQAEIDASLKRARSCRNKSERRAIYQLIKELRKDFRQRERKVVRDLILKSKIVVSTLHTAGSVYVGDVVNFLGSKPLFDTIIIDEVSQALVPQCWIPAAINPEAKRLVIAGDNKQLPPTIKCADSPAGKLLEKTLFDQLVDAYGESIKHLLTVQYRMSEEIMRFPSEAMYDGKLIADVSVASQKLFDLTNITKNATTESSVLWIDTMGDMFPEEKEEDSFSLRNPGEADIVATYVSKLLESGTEKDDIGIISPYSAQVSVLKHKVAGVEVSTVDGFQGREKEVIILSLVRSNDEQEVGFLSDDRRINVAITRPRRQLCIVGNSETVGKSGFMKKWVTWTQDNNDIEYPEC